MRIIKGVLLIATSVLAAFLAGVMLFIITNPHSLTFRGWWFDK